MCNFTIWWNSFTKSDQQEMLDEPLAFAKLAFACGKVSGNKNDTIDELVWNPPTMYEPVGATVKIKTESGIFLAFRRVPALNKNKGVYYKKLSSELVTEEILGWTYP